MISLNCRVFVFYIQGQAVIVHSIPNPEPPAPTWLTVANEEDVVFKLQTCSTVDVVLGTYVLNDRVSTYTVHLSKFNSTIMEDTTQVNKAKNCCLNNYVKPQCIVF